MDCPPHLRLEHQQTKTKTGPGVKPKGNRADHAMRSFSCSLSHYVDCVKDNERKTTNKTKQKGNYTREHGGQQGQRQGVWLLGHF